ncbi:MAG TPA: hypothetical protein VGK67_25425 [Myxococcales bacterium]|jgi:hypothetical protein
MTPGTPPGAGRAEEAGDLFDWSLARAFVGFGLRAVRRHWVLGLGSFVFVLGMAAAALAVLPKTYQTGVKILTARNQVMTGLANPGRAVPREADAPTQAASELILRRDNLVALTKQTNLLDQWDGSRAPAVAAKDWLVGFFRGPPSEEDRLNALVGVLEKRLKVTTGDDGTVTIDIEWPDAQMAYQLADAAQQNFIETRHAVEVSTITEAISILEWHASSMGDNVQSVLEELRKAREASAPPPKPGEKPVARRAEPARPRRAPPDQELAQAKAILAARQRALADLEDYRRKRLAELQGQLVEQTATYAPAHPLVVATQESISAMAKDSPQTEALRREVKDLEREVASRQPPPQEASPAASLAATPAGAAARADAVFAEARSEVAAAGKADVDPSTEYLRAQLKVAIDKHQDLLGRIDGARIELDTARAAFKYRYSVVRPAQVPKEVERPKPAVVLGGGAFAAVLFALFACVAADLRGGRIVEAWQVDKLLGVPVLAEVRRS